MTTKLGIVSVRPFEQNCSTLACEETGEVVIVYLGRDIDKILDRVKQLRGAVKKILILMGILIFVLQLRTYLSKEARLAFVRVDIFAGSIERQDLL